LKLKLKLKLKLNCRALEVLRCALRVSVTASVRHCECQSLRVSASVYPV
jgi:hypothetical protein